MKTGRNHRERKPDAALSGAGTKNPVISRAAQEKTRNRDLARKLRKTGQIASLCADVSAVIEEFTDLSGRVETSLGKGKNALAKILDTMDEANFLSESLSEGSDFIGETVSALYSSVDQLHSAFGENTRILSDIVDTVNHTAVAHKDLKTLIEGFVKAEKAGDRLEASLERCAELLDVAGLNASLEAGRGSGGNAMFTLLAESIQKTSRALAPFVVDFKKTLAGIRAASDGMSGRVTELGDRIRTISVMSKGVKSAYDDLLNDLSELSQWGESISLKTFEAFPDHGDVPPGSQAIAERSESALALIDAAEAELGRRNTVFAPVFDLSSAVSAAASRLAGEQTSIDVLDDLVAAAEELIDLAGELDAVFGTAAAGLADLSKEAEALEQQTELMGDQLEVLSKTSAEILDTTGSIDEKLESIDKSLSESRTAVTSIAGEIDGLEAFTRTFDHDLLELEMSLERVSRFAYPLTSLISKLEFTALQGGIETARSDGNSPGFTAIAGSLETIAGEIRTMITSLFEYTDSLERQSAEISVSYGTVDWAGVSALITVLAEDADEADIMLSSALEGAGNTVSSMQRYIKDIDRVRDSIREVVVSAESAASLITDTGALTASQKETLGRMTESGEKLMAHAETLYPEEA